MLHLTGNLNYYIGAQIAATGYVRDRPIEFSDATPPSKADALRNFDAAVGMVVRTIESQSAEDWAKPYEGRGADGSIWDDAFLCNAFASSHWADDVLGI